MEYNKILYAKDSSGDTLTWEVIVTNCYGGLGKPDYATIDIIYGKLYHKRITKSTKVTEGKNIGKSNETTYLEQAINQAKSMVDKKIQEGYRDNITKLSTNRQDTDGFNKPMLAQKFVEDKFEYPALIQPKLNGIRAELGIITKSDGLFGEYDEVYLKSRAGTLLPVPDTIKASYLALIKSKPDIKSKVLDGELYIHGAKLQDIVSASKKENTNTSKLEYWVFDYKSDEPQLSRLDYLQQVRLNLDPYSFIKILSYSIVSNDKEAIEYAERYATNKYEGAILRNIDAPYQYGKRTKYMVKIKRVFDKQLNKVLPFYEDEFKLIDIVPTEKDYYNGHNIGIFICKNDINDLTFTVTPEATKQERFQMLEAKDKLINKLITVRYRERTKDGLPFHANGIIRNYE
jgi:ATP-dependent DNA ligase